MTPAALLLVVASAGDPTAELPPVVPPEPRFAIPVVHSLALMTVMRGTESVLWPDPFSRPAHFGAHYEEAFTKPPRFDSGASFMRWDGDSLFINVVGHGLFGSELYLRARQCHFGWVGSLAFAAAGSTLWEYGFEANGVRPSAQDLVYTPLAGALFGEGRFFIHRAAERIESKTGRAIVRALVDPFGEIERAAGTDC